MAKIQIDLNDEEDRIVEIFKISRSFNTKQDAIKCMIAQFDAEVKPKKINGKEYFNR